MTHISSNFVAFHVSDIASNDYTAMAVQQRNYNDSGQVSQYRNQYNLGNSNHNLGHTPSYQTGTIFSNGQGSYSGNTTNYKSISILAGQDRRQYFCDHCKIAGHTIQRCYKIHGFPPGHILYKGRRMAAAVHSDQVGYNPAQNVTTTSSSIAPPLTSKQHSQLMQLLSKHSSDVEATNGSGDISTAGFLAGKRYCMLTSLAQKAWILDSGVSDHITPDLSLLHNVRKVQVACYLNMPNGRQAQVEHVSSLVLARGLTLENVLHIPEF